MILRKCFEKSPEARYQSAGELRADLERLAARRRLCPRLLPRAPGPGAAAGSPSRAVFSSIAVVALAALWRSGRLRGGTAGGRIDSLAVLPLSNISKDPEQEYFADGMTEALIAELSRIRALKVISRTSVMQYKDAKKPLPEIARALGVKGVVEGSVMRAGDSVRITVQLIDADSDRHLWAESYTREAKNVLALQSEVATAIAREVRVAVTPGGGAAARGGATRRSGGAPPRPARRLRDQSIPHAEGGNREGHRVLSQGDRDRSGVRSRARASRLRPQLGGRRGLPADA